MVGVRPEALQELTMIGEVETGRVDQQRVDGRLGCRCGDRYENRGDSEGGQHGDRVAHAQSLLRDA